MGLRTVVGSASLKANDWVDAFQDPFGKTLSGIYDPLLKASQSGSLTYQQANDALTQFNEQWNAYNSAVQQWRAKGGDYKTVVDQSLDPNGDFMKTVNMVKGALTGWVSSLQPAATDAANQVAPPTAQTVLGGASPNAVAEAAALRARKQAAAGGTASTILTSWLGLKSSSSNLQRSTILGYAA